MSPTDAGSGTATGVTVRTSVQGSEESDTVCQKRGPLVYKQRLGIFGQTMVFFR